jgi:hypothetical protein
MLTGVTLPAGCRQHLQTGTHALSVAAEFRDLRSQIPERCGSDRRFPHHKEQKSSGKSLNFKDNFRLNPHLLANNRVFTLVGVAVAGSRVRDWRGQVSKRRSVLERG